MIPLRCAREPEYFGDRIRQPGLRWLRKHHISLTEPAPKKTRFKSFWTVCKEDLYASYQGYCAYTCLHINPATGNANVEHIKPKRLFPALAYEWTNYCLACGLINAKKGEKTDLLNPFDVTEGLFTLVLETGHILVTQNHPQAELGNLTLETLDLNNDMWCRERQKCVCEFIKDRKEGLSLPRAAQKLHDASLFIWQEAQKQGWLT